MTFILDLDPGIIIEYLERRAVLAVVGNRRLVFAFPDFLTCLNFSCLTAFRMIFTVFPVKWNFASGVVRSLPWRVAMDLALRGTMLEAEDALRHGFVNVVVPKSQVLEEARRVVADYASVPPLDAQMAKRMAILGREHPDHLIRSMRDLYYAAGFNAADAKEGVRAFVDKRKPVYTGKVK